MQAYELALFRRLSMALIVVGEHTQIQKLNSLQQLPFFSFQFERCNMLSYATSHNFVASASKSPGQMS